MNDPDSYPEEFITDMDERIPGWRSKQLEKLNIYMLWLILTTLEGKQS